MKLLKLTSLFLVLFAATTLYAQTALTIESAKQSGLVGEKLDGYLGAVASAPSKETTALISEINNKRRTKYQEIAKQNAASLSSVEKLGGIQAIEKTGAGNYIEKAPGHWLKK